MTNAQLGITVTSNAGTAAADLDKLTASSSKAEQATEALASSAAQGSTATRQMEQAVEAAALANGRAAAASSASTGALRANTAAAAANANAMRANSFQTANLVAQFNDIGMMMASGQSPLLLAMQQGTQVSQVIGPMGATGAVRALGAAFVGMLNPVNIATIATIGLGAAAFQYFSALLTDGEDGNDVLQDQQDLIARVAERWGDATPALQAYVDELERARNASDLQGAVEAAIGQEFAALRGQLPDLLISLAEAQTDLQALGASSTEIANLRGAFDEFARGVEDGSASTEDLDHILSILASTTGSETVPSLVSLQGVLGGVAAALDNASAAANRFRIDATFGAIENMPAVDIFASREFIAEQERLNGLTREQLDLEREVARIRSQAEDAGATNLLNNEAEITRLAEERLAAEERRSEIAREARSAASGGGSIATDADAYERATQAVRDNIAALEQQQQAFGLSETAAARFNTAMDLLRAAQESGIPVTAELIDEINGLANAYAVAEEAGRQMAEQQRFMEQIQSTVSSGFADLFKGIVTGSKSAMDAIGDLLGRLGELLLNRGFELLFGGLGGGGGGLLGGILIPGILHSGGIAGVDGYGHGRAFPVSTWDGAERYHNGGTAGMPGLRAGEVPAILQRGERVIPANQNGGAMELTVHVVSDDEKFSAYVTDQAGTVVARAAPGIVAASTRSANQSAPAAIGRFRRDIAGRDWRTA